MGKGIIVVLDSIKSCMKPSWDWLGKAWIEENQKESKTTIDSFFREIGNLYNTVQEAHDQCRFRQFFDKYVEFLRYENGKLSKFWLAYLDMVEIP